MTQIYQIFDTESSGRSTMTCTILNTLNFTNMEFMATTFLYSFADQLLMTIVIPIISFFGITCNVIFVLMIIRLRRMRNSLNAYLGNLAMSDILFLTFACFWYLLIYYSSPILYDMPVSSSFGCVILNIPFYFGHLASMGFITLISFERYYAICHPMQHRIMKTRRRTICLVITTWTVVIGTSILLIPGYSQSKKFCVIWPDTPTFQDFPMIYTKCIQMDVKFAASPEIILSCTFILVLLINMILHAQIICTISASASFTDNRSGAQQNIRSNTNKVTLTLAVNTLIYFLCQTPYRLHAIDSICQDLFHRSLMGFDIGSGSTLWIISEVCLFLNSAINPFVFAVGSSFYRKGFRDALMINPKLFRKFKVRNSNHNSSVTRWTHAQSSVMTCKCEIVEL